MKLFNKITAIFAITSFLLVSCNTKEKEYNLTLNDGTEVFYISNDENAISISGWNEFNAINKNLLNLKDKDYNITIQSLEDLNGSITNLANTIPSSLKTEEVLEDIRDVQEAHKSATGKFAPNFKALVACHSILAVAEIRSPILDSVTFLTSDTALTIVPSGKLCSAK